MKNLLSLLLVMSVAGCASSTVIHSVPEGASLYLNGEKVGTTPYIHTDRKMSGTYSMITLKKDNHQEFKAALARNEEVNYWAVFSGVVLVAPLFWVMDYKPVHTYELTPIEAAK